MDNVVCYGAIDKDGAEWLYDALPVWNDKDQEWYRANDKSKCVQVPKGTLHRLTGIYMTYEDDPIRLR